MRKLPILLVLLLASLLLLAAAASAHAVGLPAPAASLLAHPQAAESDDAEADDSEAADEAEAADDEETADDEECEAGEGELCESEDLEAEEAEECLLEDASASFTAAPGARQVRLRVHYRAFEPAEVVVDARLRGTKGTLRLGTDRARFHRAGVYRYSFDLDSKQAAKAVAAKDLEVGLYAVGDPADCEMHLVTRAPRRAR
jgi:hypothetical protein